jgi:hypothetical protein
MVMVMVMVTVSFNITSVRLFPVNSYSHLISLFEFRTSAPEMFFRLLLQKTYWRVLSAERGRGRREGSKRECDRMWCVVWMIDESNHSGERTVQTDTEIDSKKRRNYGMDGGRSEDGRESE